MAWAALGKAALNYAKPLLKEVGKTVLSEGVSQGIQALSGGSQSEPDNWLGDDKHFNPPQTQKSNVGQGANNMVNPVQRGINRVGEGVVNAGVDQILGLFNGGGVLPNNGQDFSAQQAVDARNENQGFGEGKSRDQAEYEQRMRRDDDLFKQQLNNSTYNFTADLGNRAANANTARSMALDTTQNLNRMYATAGDRLGQSAANTQNALNQAAAVIAGMFR